MTRLRLRPAAQPQRLIAPTLALAAFYGGLFWVRIPAAPVPGSGLEEAESRRLQDESAVLRRFGKWERAVAPTLRLHTAYPESHIYIAHLAEIYAHLGRHREEAAMWEQFLERSPAPIEGCPQIAEAYRKQGMAVKSINALERCLAIDPTNPDSIFNLAHALERNGDLEKSAALYARGFAAAPNYWDFGVGLARTRLRQGYVAEARRIAGQIVGQAPENVDGLLVLGLACRRQGDRPRARSYLEKGAHLSDRYADFHLALGQMAEEDSNVDSAIRHYQKAVDAGQGNSDLASRIEALKKVRQ